MPELGGKPRKRASLFSTDIDETSVPKGSLTLGNVGRSSPQVRAIGLLKKSHLAFRQSHQERFEENQSLGAAGVEVTVEISQRIQQIP
jgi:hypothetical protein